MKQKVKNIILNTKLISGEKNIGVAVSGGADSVALLYVLKELQNELGLNLVVLHVNHGIRGAEADRDEQFVAKLAKKLKVDFAVKKVNAVDFASKNKFTLEQAARILRYDAFASLKEEYNLSCVCLAHNQDDQAETILMHLFRGAGATGMTGMRIESGFYVRPLLMVSRSEIERYISSKSINHIEDSTNSDTSYTRNFIRHKILPQIEERYGEVKTNICEMGNIIKENEEFIDSCIPEGIIELNGDRLVLKKDVKTLHKVVAKKAIIKCFYMLNANIDVEKCHIESVFNLLNSIVGKKLDMPNNIVVQHDYNGLIFSKKDEVREFGSKKFKCAQKIETPLGEIEVRIVKSIERQKGKLFIDANKLPKECEWRTVATGDMFTKFGGGTKSLKAYLTDKKIGSSTRKKIVVLASRSEVLVIPGIEIADKLKITDKTKEVIEICLK